jgi:hypothetical protein
VFDLIGRKELLQTLIEADSASKRMMEGSKWCYASTTDNLKMLRASSVYFHSEGYIIASVKWSMQNIHKKS